MAAFSEWLQLMLAEMARKRDEQERARAEELAREVERAGGAGTACGRSPGNLTGK